MKFGFPDHETLGLDIYYNPYANWGDYYEKSHFQATFWTPSCISGILIFPEEVEIANLGFLLLLDISQAISIDIKANNVKISDIGAIFGRHLGFPPYWIF